MLQSPFMRLAAWRAVSAAAFAQGAAPAGAPLEFEVASVKSSGPLDVSAIVSGKAHVGMTVDNARVDIGSAPLLQTHLPGLQGETGSSGRQAGVAEYRTQADRFDIVAKLPAGATKEQVPEMLKALLADRFKLKLHRDTRETPVYALVVAKGGLKIKEVADEPPPTNAASPAGASTPEEAKPAAPPAKGEMVLGTGENQMRMKPSGSGMVINSKATGEMRTSVENGMIHMQFEKATVEMLMGVVMQYLDRPVVDQTGLKGKYQAELEMSLADAMRVAQRLGVNVPPRPAAEPSQQPADAASDPSGSTVFTSIQRLGLKLEPQKLPYDFIVIDHVERTPSDN